MATTYDYAPLQYLSAGEAFSYAVPPSSFLGKQIKFTRNTNGQTVFEYVDPDKVWMKPAYQKKSNGSYQLDSKGFLIPLYNSDGSVKMEPDTLSDGTPITNKVWMEKVEHFQISPDGRSLSSNLESNQRSVSGYTSDSKWTINGSGNNETIQGKFANDWSSGVYSSPLYNIADIPTEGLNPSEVSNNYQKYLTQFSNLAKGINQRITSKTVSDSGILEDIKNTVGQLGPLVPIALMVAFPGVGAAIGGSLGLSGAAATLAGNTILQTALNGGDLSKGLTSAVIGEIGQQAGILGDQAATAAQYGTDVGSAQTAALAAQEAGLGTATDVAGNIIGGTAAGVAAGKPLEEALTGSLVSQGINTAAGSLATPTTEQSSEQPMDTSQFQNVYGGELPIEDIQAAFDTTGPLADTTAALDTAFLQDMDQGIQPQVPAENPYLAGMEETIATEGAGVAGAENPTGTTVTTPETTQEATKNLTPQQISQLLKLGLGLFGGGGALAAAAKGLMGGSTGSAGTGATLPTIQPPTPFTGTYSGMNPYDAAYFQQVQQNYNRLFPTAPIEVATPLQSWYQTQYKPDTTISNKLFGV